MSREDGHFMSLPGVVRFTSSLQKLSEDDQLPKGLREFYSDRFKWFNLTLGLYGYDLSFMIKDDKQEKMYTSFHSSEEVVQYLSQMKDKHRIVGLILGH